MKPHVPLLLYGLAGELATAVPITGSVGPDRHAVVDDPMSMRPVNWPLPAQGPPRNSNMTATTLLTAPYKRKRSVETVYSEHDTFIGRLFPYWKTVEVFPFRQPEDEQPVDEKPAEEQSADQKPAEQKPADKKPAEKKPVDKKPAEKKPADKKPTEKKPAAKKPAEKKPDGKKTADKKLADKKKPADKKPADKKPDGKKADSNAAAATTTKKPSPDSDRITKNGPFKVVSADINNSANNNNNNKQADSSSAAAAATTTKKNDDCTSTGSSSTFKQTEDQDNGDNNNNNNNNGNNINSGSTVYESNISNSTVDDSVISNSTVVDSRVLDSTVSDANLVHSTVVDDVVIDSSTLEDTTVAGQSAVTEGSTLSGSDVLGGSAVAGGSTVIDSNILDGASVVDGSTVIGESRVGEGSAVAGGSNVFDGSVVTRTRRDLLAKRKMPWMPDSAKLALCIFTPFIGCPMAIASEVENQGKRPKRQLVDVSGSGSGSGSGSVVTLTKRVKNNFEMTGMVIVCTFLPFLCPLYGDGREKRQLADGGSDSGSSAVTLDKRGMKPMPVKGKIALCVLFVLLCPFAIMSGSDAAGTGYDKRELADGSNGISSISSAIDTPVVYMAKRDKPPKKLSKPARAAVCFFFPFICPVVWRRGLDDPAPQISSSDSDSSNSNTALSKRSAEPEAKDARLRQCGAPLPWWCSNVTKRSSSTTTTAAAAVANLNKRKWTPARFILCRMLFIFCFFDLTKRDLAHDAPAPAPAPALTPNTDTDTDITSAVAKKKKKKKKEKRSPQDEDLETHSLITPIAELLGQEYSDYPPPVTKLPPGGDPANPDEVDKKRKRSSVELNVAKRQSSWSKAISMIAGGTVIIDWLNKHAQAAIQDESDESDDELDDLFDRKRSAVPPERRDVAAAAVESRNTNTDDPPALSGDGDDDGDDSKVSEVSDAIGSLIDGINGKRSSSVMPAAEERPGGAAEEEESMMMMTKRAADRTTEFYKPLRDFPGHGNHRVKEFNIPAYAPRHGHYRASKFSMPPNFPGLPLSPKN